MADFNGTPDADYWFGSDGNETAHGGGGGDDLQGGGGDDIIYGEDGNDRLIGGLGADLVDGGSGDDSLVVSGSFLGSQLSAGDQFIGGAGLDTLFLDGNFQVNFDLTIATVAADIEQIRAERSTVTVGFTRFSQFSLVEGAFRLVGSGTLDLSGVNMVSGSLFFDSGNDVATAAGSSSSSRFGMFGGGGDDDLTAGEGADILSGEAGNDRLNGSGGSDSIAGGGGDDQVYGGAGNDTLYDDLGADIMDGGEGNDVFFLDLANGFSAADQLSGGAGTDSLFISAPHFTTLDLSVFNIAADFERLTAASARIVAPTEKILNLQYFEALSLKVTTAGNLVASAEFKVREIETSEFGNGIDLSAAEPPLGFSVFGGVGVDSIIGSGNFDYLSGGGGNDVIHAGGNGDELRGGDGIDWLDGGAGDDTFTIVETESVVAGDRFTGGSGTDTLHILGPSFGGIHFVDLTVAVDPDIERLTSSGTVGARLTVAQLAGFTTIQLNELHLADAGTLDLSGRTATLGYLYLNDAGNNVTLSDHNISLVIGGAANDVVTGRSFPSYIQGKGGSDILTGGGGGDTIDGGEGNDRLSGGGGDDFLVGGTGSDSMAGGVGDDTYYFDQTSDAISEFGGEGFDRLATTVTLALAPDADIERLDVQDLSITNAIDLTGSAIANVIYGNNGQNVLRGEAGNDELQGFGGNDFLVGGAGADIMAGGLGDDTFFVDDASDIIGEVAGEGNDRIAASVSFVLSNGANVEVLEAVNLLATTAFDLTGSDSANTITGNNGVNILRGEGGNDILSSAGGDDFLVGGTGVDNMTGGAGNDTYYVDSASDLVNEIAGEGNNDRVSTAVSYALSASAEVERLEAANSGDTSAINLTGSASSNAITGNAGANILNGGAGGNDVLAGLGGADSFQFTSTLDSSNADVIVDFVSGTDTIALDDAVFAGLTPGVLNPNAFKLGSQANEADDRIVYNQATGQLFYDPDGDGGGAQMLFATLSGAPALAASDFTVI